MGNELINLAEQLAQFSEHWAPRTVAQLNDYDVMVVKVQGEFVWHTHAETDDFFLVLKGRLTIRLRDREVALGPGDAPPCIAATEIALLLLFLRIQRGDPGL